MIIWGLRESYKVGSLFKNQTGYFVNINIMKENSYMIVSINARKTTDNILQPSQ